MFQIGCSRVYPRLLTAESLPAGFGRQEILPEVPAIKQTSQTVLTLRGTPTNKQTSEALALRVLQLGPLVGGDPYQKV
eukprot:120461-Heterocapsa_arctica.AAC.1